MSKKLYRGVRVRCSMRMALLLVAILLASHRTAARGADVQAADPARTFSADLQAGGKALAGQLGKHGAWVIQSQERWDALQATLQKHKANIEDKTGKVDFAKENVAVIFHYGDVADRFRLKGVDAPQPGLQGNIDFAMSYVIYKQREETVSAWRCFGVVVPKFEANTISVYTFHPMNGGEHSDPKSAQLEWQWTVSPSTGEAVGGLCAVIMPKAGDHKDDILVQITLKPDGATKASGGHFAPATGPLRVWDGKYSNGYRNHGFEVVTPDGKLHMLRPAIIKEWDKNAPHPVEIIPDKPYTLPNWVEGDTFKSLKALGLDVTQKGPYTITGTYEEVREPAKQPDADLWGGVLRSNTIRVTRE